MAIPQLPTTLEHLGDRRFSFSPPILRIERNEWLFLKASWSELLVVNAHTGREMSIPRRFLGQVSRMDEPLLIVGLVKELEYRDGAVRPHQQRVIEMPVAAGAENLVAVGERLGPATIVQISLHSGEDARRSRKLAGAMVIGMVGVLVLAGVAGESQVRPRVRSVARDVSYRDLRAGDDANMVERILGPSARENWNPDSRQLQLSYPQRGYAVVLTGQSRGEARYSGIIPLRASLVRQ